MSDPRVDALQADIEQTREELADTVDDLAAKFDVKSRLHDATMEPDGRPKPVVMAIGGGVLALVAALVAVRIWSRRGR